MKKLFAILFAVILSTSVYAQRSNAFSDATYNTIADDSYYLFNLIDWNKLEFDKAFIGASTIYNNFLQLYSAFHIGQNTLMVGLEGNLWADNALNRSYFLFGHKNFSVYANYEQLKNGKWEIFETEYYGKMYCPTIGFGYNIDEKNAISTTVNYNYINGTDIDVHFTRVNATYKKNLVLSKTKNSSFQLKYDTSYLNGNNNVTNEKTNYFIHCITPTYKLETKLNEKLDFGFLVYVPFGYIKKTSKTCLFIDPITINNGFSYQFTQNLLGNIGISIKTPSINFPKEGDVYTGIFYSRYSLGLTFMPSSNIKIDGSCYFTPSAGLSLNDIQSYELALSVSAKF